MPPEKIDSLADDVKPLGLLEQISGLTARVEELLAQNKALLARIAELEAEHGKPPKTPDNSSLPPSRGQKGSVAEATRVKKARKGHPGAARALAENPDATRDVYAERCGCGAALAEAGQELARAWEHVDLPPIKPITTRINLFRATCPCCKARVTAQAPADMPEGSPFGPGIKAAVAYLHGCQLVGFKRLTELCEGLFGLTISQGAISNMLARMGKPFGAAAEQIAATVRASEVIASDETSARVKGNGRPQVAALEIGRLEVQQAIQLAVEAAPMRCDRAVDEIGPPVPDRAGILQERLELRCEDRVAVIDRVLRITDQMGEAELVRLGVCALRRQAIRQPHLRPHAGEKVRRHALAARRRDHMIDGGGAAERPLPVRLALHARAGLVAGDHLAGAHGGGDLLCCRAERLAHTCQHVGDRALGDGQAEQAFAQLGQTLEADQLAAVQISDRSLYAGSERRALGHVGRRLGGDARLAARARGAEQIDPCCDRLDRRQIDMVPGPREFLACLFERDATRAALGVDVACRVRVLGERSRRARMAFAGFPHPRRLRDVPLLTARRRQRRVSGVSRRLAMLGLKLGNAGQQRLVLRHQLVDARRKPADLPQQFQHQRLHIVSERIDLLRRHASLNQLAWKSSTLYTRVIPPQRGE